MTTDPSPDGRAPDEVESSGASTPHGRSAALVTFEDRRRVRLRRTRHLAAARGLGRALRALAVVWLGSPRGPQLPPDLEFAMSVTRAWVRLLEARQGTSHDAPSLRLLRCQAAASAMRTMRNFLPPGCCDPRAIPFSAARTRASRHAHQALQVLHHNVETVRQLPP